MKNSRFCISNLKTTEDKLCLLHHVLSGLPGLLGLVEDLYKHSLETLLKNNAADMQYFHNDICSEETKVYIHVVIFYFKH